MERLTKWNESLGRYTLKDGCARGTAGKVNRVLGEYEDTGLAPEQIRELDKLYAELCEELAKYRWIPVEERLPEDEEALVLIQVSGKPTNNITLEDALMMASYNVDDGWILEMYPEWEGAHPVAWMPLPEPYGGERK